MPKLIAFCGLAGSGKSTAARHLITNHHFVKTPFAGPLKNMLAVLGLNHEQLNGSLKEIPTPLLGGKTPRWAMQTLGTEWGRELIYENIWVDAWKYHVQRNFGDNYNIVVDDLRFPNEEATVRSLGGKIIKIIRDVPGVHVNSTKHESESCSIAADLTIYNTKTISALEECLDRIIPTL